MCSSSCLDVFTKDHVATTAGFVVGERSVPVVESMLHGDLASQLIGLVRQVTTKPIRFLVNTSYHGLVCRHDLLRGRRCVGHRPHHVDRIAAKPFRPRTAKHAASRYSALDPM